MQFWINVETNRVITTPDNIIKVLEYPWKEVCEKEYAKKYQLAWEAAMNCGMFHC